MFLGSVAGFEGSGCRREAQRPSPKVCAPHAFLGISHPEPDESPLSSTPTSLHVLGFFGLV